MSEDHRPTTELRFIKRVSHTATYEYIAAEKVLQQLWEPIFEHCDPEWRDVPLLDPEGVK